MDPNANTGPRTKPPPAKASEIWPFARPNPSEPREPPQQFDVYSDSSENSDFLDGSQDSDDSEQNSYRRRQHGKSPQKPAIRLTSYERQALLGKGVKSGVLEANLRKEINHIPLSTSNRPDTHIPSSFPSYRSMLAGEIDVMRDIGLKITKYLKAWETSKKDLSTISFRLTRDVLDIFSFLQAQKYSGDWGQALKQTIAITGKLDDAEAMTVEEYLCRTWPATGHKLSTFLGKIPWKSLDSEEHKVKPIIRKSMYLILEYPARTSSLTHGIANITSNTSLTLTISRKVFDLKVEWDNSAILIEIAQQLAWVGAALQSSPTDRAILICTPDITADDGRSDPKAARSAYDFRITFTNIKYSPRISLSGDCWHRMFSGPVVVRGFPIRRKAEINLGIEMPLNMIAHFAGSNRVVEFDNKLFIKGYSTMLIATKVLYDMVVWHYYFDENGRRLSYFDHDLNIKESVTLYQLEKARHVIGWCETCDYCAGESTTIASIKKEDLNPTTFTGAADAIYNIGRTNLPRPSAGFMLENISISAGKIIHGGVTFLPGVRDMPPHLTLHGRVNGLRWISSKYFLFWDDRHKRGWLINGLSALLHLLMGALEHYSTDEFSDSFLFNAEELERAESRSPTAAMKVLMNPRNRVLKIYPDRIRYQPTTIGEVEPSFFLFDDLIDQFYNTLEQINDYYIHLAGRNGVNLKPRSRKHLEGWDFVDLISGQDPLPRVATIPTQGYGWIDFIRSINAIPIFGLGFGHLIKPAPSLQMCPHWSTLPRDRYLLAASNADLIKIMCQFGDRSMSPWLLTQDLEWRPLPETMLICSCKSRPEQRTPNQHVEPVQILRPANVSHRSSKQLPNPLSRGGAVIFGHNKRSGFLGSGTEHKHAKHKTPGRKLVVFNSNPSHSSAIGASSLSNSISNSMFYSAISSTPIITNISSAHKIS